MSTKDAIYLDVNAGAAVHPEVVKGLLPLLQDNLLSANPSSVHAHGRKTKSLLSEARRRIALSLGASSSDREGLTFTSSGTDANQSVIRAVFEPCLGTPAHWITTPVEHESNLGMVDWLKERGVSVSLLPVDSQGAPVISELKSLLRAETKLVSVIWVNNETGVVTDIESLLKGCSRAQVPLHLDGAQAWGKIPVELDQLSSQGLSYATFAPYKIGAFAGLGVVWSGRGHPKLARRGGTENITGIVAAGIASSFISLSEQEEIHILRDRLQAKLSERISGMHVNGDEAPRIAGTLNISFDGIGRDGLIASLDLEGYSVSSGSACASGVVEASHVLLAMGRSREQAQASVRVSFSSQTSWSELERFAEALERVITRLRASSNQKTKTKDGTIPVSSP